MTEAAKVIMLNARDLAEIFILMTVVLCPYMIFTAFVASVVIGVVSAVLMIAMVAAVVVMVVAAMELGMAVGIVCCLIVCIGVVAALILLMPVVALAALTGLIAFLVVHLPAHVERSEGGGPFTLCLHHETLECFSALVHMYTCTHTTL